MVLTISKRLLIFEDMDLAASVTKALAKPSSKKARLLDAAEELFARRGFDAVTVREISSAAGANVATLHLHWKDKRTLYEAVCHAQAQYLAERIERFVLEAPNPRDVDAWLDTAIDLMVDRPALAPLALQSLSGQLPEGSASLLEHDADFFRGLERVLVGTLGLGRPRAESKLAMMSMIYFLVLTFNDSPVQQALLGGSPIASAATRKKVRRFGRTLMSALVSTLEPKEKRR